MKAKVTNVAASASTAQQGNKSWWTENTMSYDWRRKVPLQELSQAWFDEIDARFIDAARHFAHGAQPFDRIIPFERLAGKRVLEVGCGMGLHTELMTRAGAQVTAVDISPRSVASTRARLALKGLDADVRELDAELLAEPGEYDFIWSWGVIHHSSRTGRVLRNLYEALKPGGELRFMVYSLDGAEAYAVMMSQYMFGFWRGKSLDELLWEHTDGFLARYFTSDSLTNLCRTFFDDVETTLYGQESDAIPLPGGLRRLVRPLFSDRYIAKAVRRRGTFLFATATKQAAAPADESPVGDVAAATSA